MAVVIYYFAGKNIGVFWWTGKGEWIFVELLEKTKFTMKVYASKNRKNVKSQAKGENFDSKKLKSTFIKDVRKDQKPKSL